MEGIDVEESHLTYPLSRACRTSWSGLAWPSPAASSSTRLFCLDWTRTVGLDEVGLKHLVRAEPWFLAVRAVRLSMPRLTNPQAGEKGWFGPVTGGKRRLQRWNEGSEPGVEGAHAQRSPGVACGWQEEVFCATHGDCGKRKGGALQPDVVRLGMHVTKVKPRLVTGPALADARDANLEIVQQRSASRPAEGTDVSGMQISVPSTKATRYGKHAVAGWR